MPDYGPRLIDSLLEESVTQGPLYGADSLFSGSMELNLGEPLSAGVGQPRYIVGMAGEGPGLNNLSAQPQPEAQAPAAPGITTRENLDEADPARIRRAIARYEQAMGVKWTDGNEAWLNTKGPETAKWLEKWLKDEGDINAV